jgi:capsular exopolysaccharide synthesis family protein
VLLSRQAAEVSIWEQTQLGYGRVVDYAPVPKDPVKPRKLFFLLAGFILGGIAGVSIILFRELTQTQITSIERLRDVGYPVLSVVPDMRSHIEKQFGGRTHVEMGGQKISTDLVTLIDPISPISESYRRLFNNIIYSQPDINYKTLITTSSGQGEGKTTLTSNLGVIIAESDHKVILVDCDFRRPRLHNEFGLDKNNGASDWLFGDLDLEEIIKPSIVPGLDIITTGRGVKNPANLVQSKRMKELVKLLKERYDYVLIDVPPFGILSDAAPLMNMADGIILISRFNVTRNVEFGITVENLQNINVPIIGTVMTAFDYSQSTDYGYKKDYYKNSYMNYNKYVQNEKS